MRSPFGWFRHRYPFSSMMLVLTFGLVFTPLVFALGRDMLGPSCDFLACNYPGLVWPALNFLGIVLFWPLSLILLFPNFFFGVALTLLLLAYWFAIAYVPALVYAKLKGRPIPDQFTDENKRRFELGAMIYLLFLLFTALFVMTFLYYPRVTFTSPPIDFVELAALIAILLTLFSHSDRPEGQHVTDVISRVALVSIVFLAMGLLDSFFFQVRIAPPAQTTAIDLAAEEAMTVASMGSGIFGLFVIVTYIVWNLNPRRPRNQGYDVPAV